MTLRETAVFIEMPIAAVAGRAPASLPAHRLRSGGEEAWLFGAETMAAARFALRSEDAAPLNLWTQLLHPAPDDIGAMAAVLAELRVDPGTIHVSTDWEGRALLDLEALKEAVRRGGESRGRGSAPSASEGRRPALRGEHVVIDAAGMALDQAAWLAAWHLASRRGATPSGNPPPLQVLIVNVEKAHAAPDRHGPTLRRLRDALLAPRVAAARRRLRREQAMLARRKPELLVWAMIERLLRDDRLGRQRMKSLRIERGPTKGGLRASERAAEITYVDARTPLPDDLGFSIGSPPWGGPEF